MRSLALDLGAIALLLVSCVTLQLLAEPDDPAVCRDVLDESDQIACNEEAYEAWLAAGRYEFSLSEECQANMIELPKKCNMVGFLDERLQENELAMNETLLRYLKDFLNKEVIDEYMEKHRKDEPPLHLGTNEDGLDCCKSDDPEGPDQLRLQELLEARIGPMRTEFKRVNATVTEEELYEAAYDATVDLVQEPCAHYLYIMEKLLFGDLMGAVTKFMGNDWSFLDQQSEDFRRAVFRYQFCSKSSMDASDWFEK